MKDYSNLDGEVLNYDVASAISVVRNPKYKNKKVINYTVLSAMDKVPTNTFDEDNFYPLDGLDGLDDAELSNASGKKKKRGGFFQKVVDYTPIGMVKKGLDRRAIRKQTEADAQLQASKGIGKESKSDIELARSLRTMGASAKGGAKKGLSTIAWVGIGFGALALVGVTVFLIKRKK